eukprot:m.7027 g.7027  ORF g.7027 m.7027 type:complete len:511 (+) comp3634_c0_seq1:294-1826(+)
MNWDDLLSDDPLPNTLNTDLSLDHLDKIDVDGQRVAGLQLPEATCRKRRQDSCLKDTIDQNEWDTTSYTLEKDTHDIDISVNFTPEPPKHTFNLQVKNHAKRRLVSQSPPVLPQRPQQRRHNREQQNNRSVCWNCLIHDISVKKADGHSEDSIVQDFCGKHIVDDLPQKYYHRTINCRKSPKADIELKRRIKNRLNKARIRECSKNVIPGPPIPGPPQEASFDSGQDEGPSSSTTSYETPRELLLKHEHGEKLIAVIDTLSEEEIAAFGAAFQDKVLAKDAQTYLANRQPSAGLGLRLFQKTHYQLEADVRNNSAAASLDPCYSFNEQVKNTIAIFECTTATMKKHTFLRPGSIIIESILVLEFDTSQKFMEEVAKQLEKEGGRLYKIQPEGLPDVVNVSNVQFGNNWIRQPECIIIPFSIRCSEINGEHALLENDQHRNIVSSINLDLLVEEWRQAVYQKNLCILEKRAFDEKRALLFCMPKMSNISPTSMGSKLQGKKLNFGGKKNRK